MTESDQRADQIHARLAVMQNAREDDPSNEEFEEALANVQLASVADLIFLLAERTELLRRVKQAEAQCERQGRTLLGIAIADSEAHR